MKRRRLLQSLAASTVSTSSAEFAFAQTPQQNAIKRLAFGSCIDQDNSNQAIWDPVLAAKPELFLFGGDNVYASEQPFRIAQLTHAYELLGKSQGFKQLRQTTPHLALWDDNDYGLNDGGIDWSFKQASKDAFLKFWNVPANDPRQMREGIYTSVMYGPLGRRLQVILLDIRWNKSTWKITDQRGAPGKERYVPDADPSKTMLGAAQWKWLEEQLLQPADVRLIMSGIQVVADGHGWESWSRFPLEQQRLYDLIASTRANGVMFLSGDRHIGAFYRHDKEGAYPLYDFTSSGMTHAWTKAKELGPNRIVDLVTENHFGLIDIDWNARQMQLSIQNERGLPVRDHTIALDTLKHLR